MEIVLWGAGAYIVFALGMALGKITSDTFLRQIKEALAEHAEEYVKTEARILSAIAEVSTRMEEAETKFTQSQKKQSEHIVTAMQNGVSEYRLGNTSPIVRTAKIRHASTIVDHWLMHAPPHAVFDTLSSLVEAKYDLSDSVSLSLMGREEPLINLGLALFSVSERIARVQLELSRENQDPAVQQAVMAGPAIAVLLFPGEETGDAILSSLLEDLTDNGRTMMRLLVSNPALNDWHLANLFTRGIKQRETNHFEAISDEDWLMLLRSVICNPRLGVPDSDYYYVPELEQVCGSAWTLFNRLPVNGTNGNLLSRLGECLAPPIGKGLGRGRNVSRELERWRVDEQGQPLDFDAEEYRSYFLEETSFYSVDNRPDTDPYFLVRYYLARQVASNPNFPDDLYMPMPFSEFYELELSPDYAVQKAFYTKLIGTKGELREKLERESLLSLNDRPELQAKIRDQRYNWLSWLEK